MGYICEICGKEFDAANQLKGHKIKCGKTNAIAYCFNAQAEKIDYVRNHYDNVVFLSEHELTEDFIKAFVGIM